MKLELLMEDNEYKSYIEYDDRYNLEHVAKIASDLTYTDKSYSDKLVNAVKEAAKYARWAYDIYEEEVAKPRREAEAAKERARSQKEDIRIQLTPEQADLVDAVLGQLSDGYWENSRQAEAYWNNMDIEGNTLVINVNRLKYALPYSKWDEGDKFKNPSYVKSWFARRAQIVHNADRRDNFGGAKIRDIADQPANYLDGEINKTMGQIQDVIDSMR